MIASLLIDLPAIWPVKNNKFTVVDQIMVAVIKFFDRLIENYILYQLTKIY